ncbi:MAG: hypothetical protein LBD68_08065, partial [Zoogloeaceae bacterium]|nr:hypothetical protein [Zoogloeaceae bacterium]
MNPPRMPDETSRRSLFVAIERASRWGFPRIHDNQSEASRLDFLERLQAACPIRIRAIRTDNGNEFTDRFNGRISELCRQTRFASAAEREQTLNDSLLTYNHFIPQQAIGHRSPIDAFASCYAQHPDLFIAPVYNHTER